MNKRLTDGSDRFIKYSLQSLLRKSRTFQVLLVSYLALSEIQMSEENTKQVGKQDKEGERRGPTLAALISLDMAEP
jgi:hypothetical protein